MPFQRLMLISLICCVTSLFAGFGNVLIAQMEFIVVEKTLSNKQVQYSSGDEITYRLKVDDFFRTDHIVALNDTAIEFHYHQIPYDEIAEVDIRGKSFGNVNFARMGTTIQVVGLGYITVDQFNQVLVSGDDPSFNSNVWLAGGLIFAGGTAMKFFTPKKVKIGRKYRIRYMNIKPPGYE
jgi:hypothetical protein